MAAGSSPPPVASEKTSEGCRTTAANASRRAARCHHRRSPCAGARRAPGRASSRSRRLLRWPLGEEARAAEQTSLLPGRTSHTSTVRSKAGSRSRGGARPGPGRAPRQLEDRAAVGRSPRELPERHRRLLARIEERALSKTSRGSRKKPSSPSSVTVRRAPASGGSVTRVFSFAMFGRRKSEPFSTRRRAPSGASAVMSTPRTKPRPVGPEDELPAPACGAVAGAASVYDSRWRGGPCSRRISSRCTSRIAASAVSFTSTRCAPPAGVDHVRDLAPAPIEEAQVGKSGRQAASTPAAPSAGRARRGATKTAACSGKSRRRSASARSSARAGDDGEAEQRDEHAPAHHVPSA